MPRPCKLTIYSYLFARWRGCSGMLWLFKTSATFLTSKVSELRVTWATCVSILVFLGLSVLDLGLMYATDRRQTDRRQTDVRQTDVRRASSLNAPA